MSDPLLDLAASLKPDDRPDRLKGALNRGMQFDPDAYSKAVRVSAQTGVVPTAILRDQKTFDKTTFQVDPAEFTNLSPRAAEWLVSHDDHAPQAYDDLSTLQNLERITKDVSAQANLIAPKFFGGTARAMGGAMTWVGAKMQESAGKPGYQYWKPLADVLRQSGNDVRQYWNPVFENPVFQPETGAGKATAFVGDIGSMMGKAYLAAQTGGATVPLLFGAEGFGEAAGNALETGKTPTQAGWRGTGHGALNAALAFIPGGKFGSEAALGEAIAQGGKMAVAKELGKGLAVRGLRGTGLGTLTTWGGNAVNRVTGDPETPWNQGLKENIASFIGMEGAGYLGHAIAATAESKLKARSPETFQNAADHLFKDTPIEDTMMDAVKFQTLFQEAGVDPVVMAETLGVKNYTEALAAGTEIIIPTSKFLAHLTPEQQNAMLPDLRTSLGEATPREIEAYQKEAGKVDLKAQVEPVDKGAYQTIYEDMLAQLHDVGHSGKYAEDQADLHARVMVNIAKDFGKDPIALSQERGLRIYRPAPSEGGNPVDISLGRMGGGDALAPQEFSLDPGMDPRYWQKETLRERIDRLRQEAILRNGASDGTGLQASGEPRTPGSAGSEATPGMGQDSSLAVDGGQGRRRASGSDAFRRIREHASPEGVDAFYRAPQAKVDPVAVKFHSWDGSTHEYEASVMGRDVFVEDPRPLAEGATRSGIRLEVLPDGDLYVRVIDNGGVKGSGMFLYQEAIRTAMKAFPEVTGDSMVVGETSILGTKARMRVQGTDVLNGRNGTVSSTMVRDFLAHQSDPVASRLKSLGVDLTKATTDEAMAKLGGEFQTFFQPAYHGSPFRFDKFTLDHIGKGEGAQAYGWGLYFAGSKDVAEWYRENLTATDITVDGEKYYLANIRDGVRQLLHGENGDLDKAISVAEGNLDHWTNKDKSVRNAEESRKDLAELLDLKKRGAVKKGSGQTYKVDIPEDGKYLLWDKPLSEQPEAVKKALEGAGVVITPNKYPSLKQALRLFGSQRVLDDARSDIGIRGSLAAGLRLAKAGDVEGFNAWFGQHGNLLSPGRSNDITGESYYRQLTQDHARESGKMMVDSQERASKFLQSLGIAGIKYLDGTSRGAGEGSHNYVIFDANAVNTLETYYQPMKRRTQDYQRLRTRMASLRSLSPSHQAGELTRRALEAKAAEDEFLKWEATVKEVQAGDIHESKRGFIQFSPEHKTSIALLEKANFTTLTHELGHEYLDMMGRLAAEPDAAGPGVDSYKEILKFLKVEDASQIGTAQHEKFADAAIGYFMEGKAPTPELKGTFQRMKYWMMTAYRNLQALGVRLTPEIKGVFDRMFAGEAAVDQASKVVDLKPMFTTPEDMGTTQAVFDAYAKLSEKARATANDAVEAKLMREFQREKEAWWKAETAKVEEEVSAEVNAEPVYQAFKALTDGKLEDGTPIKINKDALEAQFGEGIGKELPRSKGWLYTREGGMDAEAAAEILGFNSGDELIQALKTMEPRKERIARLTDERMKATHGDMMTDGTLAETAIEAIHNQAREEMKMAELRELRRMQRTIDPALKAAAKEDTARAKEAMTVPPRKAFVEAAREIVDGTSPRDLQPYRYLQASERLAKESDAAFLKKDYQAAGDAKQKEILNHHLYLEATKARAEALDISEYGREGQTPKFQSKLGKAGQEYRGQWNALATRYEFRKASNVELDQRAQSLEAWATQQAAAGEGIVIDPSILKEGQPKNWREVPMAELRAVHDALKNIETVARRQRQVLDGAKRADHEDAVGELVGTAFGNLKAKPLPLDPLARSSMDKAASIAKKLNAGMVKMERVIDHLDQGDINGAWRRFIFEPLALAQFKEYELNQKVTNLLGDALEAMPKDQRHSMLDIYDIPGIGKVTRKFILSMALNWGNASNREKMLQGMGWANSPEAVGKAFDKLNRADWEFVQKTWDAIDTLWPDIADLQRRMTGVEPPRIEREAFGVTLPDGSTMTMDGGYYPVVYDRTKSSQGAMQADSDIMNSEGGFQGPVTFKGHTKERVRFSAPLNMDFEQVLIRHTAQVIKDISHREAALSVSKLIRDQRVRQAVSETMGPEYTDALMPWLKGTVNDTGGNQGIEGWKSMLMTTRSNMVLAGLSFRAGSVLVQVTDFGRAMTRVSTRHLGQAALDFASHPIDLTREVRELSSEMRGRSENLDRDTRAMLKRLQGKDGAYALTQKFGMEGLAIADTITSVTTWKGAYEQALEAGAPKEQAIREADRTVRLTMMSSAPKDLVALQRVGDVGTKFFTMFLGDATASYGIMNEGVRQIGAGKDVGSHLFKMAMIGMVVPIIGQMIKNRGPRDDEDKAWWLTKNALLSLPASIPIARDIAQSLDTGQDYKFTPVANAIDKAVKAARMPRKMIEGKAGWDDAFMQAFDAAGTLGGLPGTSQIMTSVKYLHDVKAGKKPAPKSPAEAVKNVTFGPPPKGKS